MAGAVVRCVHCCRPLIEYDTSTDVPRWLDNWTDPSMESGFLASAEVRAYCSVPDDEKHSPNIPELSDVNSIEMWLDVD